VFAWIATLWNGRPVMTASLRFALGFIALFVIGGLTGVITALIPFDWQITDTYFVVAHLHYVLIGANVFPVFAACYYWLPKMTGRMMNEAAGRWSFWLMFIGFGVGFFPMHTVGLAGMPRRVYTYPSGMGWDGMNLFVTVGSFLFALGVLVSFVNFVMSARRGRPAGANPWGADGLEWSIGSPPPAYGSVHIPTVASRHPLWDDHEEEHDPTGERILDQGRYTLSTSGVDAVPVAVAKMPEDTVVPLVLGVSLIGLFATVLLKSLWLAAGFAAASLLLAAVWLWPEKEKHAS
jgi:cytochrome c oxidase subunit 1/cytochrome c oxidase subunit I+III